MTVQEMVSANLSLHANANQVTPDLIALFPYKAVDLIIVRSQRREAYAIKYLKVKVNASVIRVDLAFFANMTLTQKQLNSTSVIRITLTSLRNQTRKLFSQRKMDLLCLTWLCSLVSFIKISL